MRASGVSIAWVLVATAACGGADTSRLFAGGPDAPQDASTSDELDARAGGDGAAGGKTDGAVTTRDGGPVDATTDGTVVVPDAATPDATDDDATTIDAPVGECAQGDRRCASGVVQVCGASLTWGDDPSCTFAADPSCYAGACPTVVLKGTVAASGTVKYGGPPGPYCAYEEQLTNVALTVTATPGGVVLGAHVDDTTTETSVKGCPYPGSGASAQSFDAAQGAAIQQQGTSLTITFTQGANQVPGCSLVLDGTFTGDPKVSGTLTWTRTDLDPTKKLNWQNDVSIDATP